MATVQNIIDRAVDRSGLNYPEMAGTAPMINIVSQEQRKLYLLAAQIDPEYFGKSGDTAARTVFTGAWDLSATPGDVGAVTKAEVKTITGAVTGVAVGDKVNLVNLRFPGLEVLPRAYVRGRKIVPHSTELGAADANMVTVLTVYYSELPASVSAVGTAIVLPDEWTNMLVLPLTRMLAIRDRRMDEVQLIDAEYASYMGAFQEAVRAYAHGSKRPISAISAIPTSGATPPPRG